MTDPTAGEEAPKKTLFHTVDGAASGIDAHQGVVYFTAYNDRTKTAEKVVDILPALIEHLYDKDTAKAWFSHVAFDSVGQVNFHCDGDGNWLGTWSTWEDELNDDIIDEDMGINVDLGDIVLQDRPSTLLTEDDASVHTFGGDLNRPEPPKNQPTGEATQAGSAASVTEAASAL